MALLAKDDGSGPRERPVPGMCDAICIFVVDIGKHLQKSIHGDKIQHKVVICWEIDQLLREGEYSGKPFMVSSRYTFTLFEKGNLSKMLESWFSKKIPDETRKAGFDLESLVGRKATLNLIESEDGKYINVGAVLPANKNNNMVQVCAEIPAWIKKLQDTQIRDANEPNYPEQEHGNQEGEILPF